MYSERADTCSAIDRLGIPPSTIAALAHVAPSKVSEYRRQLDVSARASSRIEKVVCEITDLVSTMQRLVGMRPDLRDVPALKSAIQELQDARRLLDARSQLAAAELQVATALHEMTQA